MEQDPSAEAVKPTVAFKFRFQSYGTGMFVAVYTRTNHLIVLRAEIPVASYSFYRIEK
jgi:hypothetical protein